MTTKSSSLNGLFNPERGARRARLFGDNGFWYKKRGMNPVCFRILDRPIYWYGVMVAAAFLAAVIHWNALARRTRRPPGFGSELGFWIMLCGIVGARIAFIISELPSFVADPGEMLRVDRGGLIFYGGSLGAALGMVVLARVRKEPILSLADFTVTGLPLGHALGRIGCFINGCCYGSPTGLGFGATYPKNAEAWNLYGDVPLHPVQLYEAVFNLLLYGFLLWAYPRRKRNGEVLALYLMTYPIARFLLEFVRGDPRLHWLGLTVAQEISLGLFVVGLALAFIRRGKKSR